MATTSDTTIARPRTRGRLYLWLGLGLALLGPVLYTAQLMAQRLTVPWYLPILGTVAALLVLISLMMARSVWRFLAAAVVVLLACGQWFLLLSMSKLPEYAGPLASGQPFPAFSSTLSDGSTFDQSSLKGNQVTVLVFFRGRW
jgi:hypothetical protein